MPPEAAASLPGPSDEREAVSSASTRATFSCSLTPTVTAWIYATRARE